MAVALAVGLGAGLITDSRWSLLATPAVFAVVFEVARMGTVGPTVDSIDLSGFFGVVQLLTLFLDPAAVDQSASTAPAP